MDDRRGSVFSDTEANEAAEEARRSLPALLVTGCAGYIGSIVCYILHTSCYSRYRVVGVDLEPTAHRFVDVAYVGDYGDTALLERVWAEVEAEGGSMFAVLHLGAYLSVPESMVEASKYMVNNVAKTIVLMDYMLKRSCKRIIFSSSCTVYGQPDVLPVTEKTPLKPAESVYGQTKQMGEDIIRTYHQVHGFQYVIFRFFNVAGAVPEHSLGDHHDQLHLVPIALSCALRHRPFNMFGDDYRTRDGTCLRDYLHPVDIAEAHVKALAYMTEHADSHAFNLGTGEGLTVKEVIDAVQASTGVHMNVVVAARRPGDVEAVYSDPTLAQELLGWKARHSSIDNIVRTELEFQQVKHKSGVAVVPHAAPLPFPLKSSAASGVSSSSGAAALVSVDER